MAWGLRGRTLGVCRAASLSAVVALFSAAPAAAVAWETCGRASGGVAVAACSREIASGRHEAHNLAALYFNRGNLYLDKGEYDRALADFSEAIRLDPKNTDFFYSRAIAYQQ